MFPHERSLVKRLADKPFVLLGVNSDQTKEEVKQKNEKAEITWRSWFDGQGGPIAQQYKVQGFPTLYLIDPKGVVRHAFMGNPGDKKLDELIDQMLQETEKTKD